jgi:hypothetical protein
MAPLPDEKIHYEIDWQIRGGELRSSGKRELRSNVIYVDEIPAAAAGGGN